MSKADTRPSVMTVMFEMPPGSGRPAPVATQERVQKRARGLRANRQVPGADVRNDRSTDRSAIRRLTSCSVQGVVIDPVMNGLAV
jgi:hypothetical protein